MSNAKHTAGPWHVLNGYDGHTTICIMRSCDRSVSVSAEEGALPQAWQATEANARLIAAAPDLLEACLGMEDIAADILANDDPSGPSGSAAQAMLDAIAKAKGAK